MSRTAVVNLIFLITGLLGSADAFLLFRRRLHREVPWFAIYLCLILTHVVVDGFLFNVDPVFFYYFIGWVFQGAAVVLELMVTIEAMRNILVDYPISLRWGRNALFAVGLAFLLIAISTLPYGAQHSDLYLRVTHLTMRSARIIQVGLIVAFFALTRYLGLASKHYQFGILLGMGLYVSASLACEAYLAQMGSRSEWGAMLVDSFTYLTTLLLWFTYISKEEPKFPPPPVSSDTDLDRWNAALGDLRNQKFGKI